MTGFAQLVQTPIIPYFIWSHVTFASSNWHFDARTVHTNYVHGVAQYTHAHSDMLFWCQAKEVFVYFIVVKTVQEIIEARLCAGGRGVWNLLKNIEGFFFFLICLLQDLFFYFHLCISQNCRLCPAHLLSDS